MLLENIELRGLRGRGGPPARPEHPAGAADAFDGGRGARPDGHRRSRQLRRRRRRPRLQASQPVPAAGCCLLRRRQRPARCQRLPRRQALHRFRSPAAARRTARDLDPNAAPRDRILIDVGPMRRDIVRQIVPEGQWEKLTERRAPADHGRGQPAHARYRAGDPARRGRSAEARGRSAARGRREGAGRQPRRSRPRRKPHQPARARGAVRPTPARRKTALSGTRLDVTFERDGKVVRAANAEVNLPNLLATVLTTTRRDRGEIPFAVGKDGQLYTQTDDDKKKIEAIGGNVTKPDEPAGTTRVGRLDRRVDGRSDRFGSALRHRAAGRRLAAGAPPDERAQRRAWGWPSSASRSSASSRSRRG